MAQVAIAKIIYKSNTDLGVTLRDSADTVFDIRQGFDISDRQIGDDRRCKEKSQLCGLLAGLSVTPGQVEFRRGNEASLCGET